MYRSHVLVCGGTGCTSSGSQQIMEALKEEIKKAGLEPRMPHSGNFGMRKREKMRHPMRIKEAV